MNFTRPEENKEPQYAEISEDVPEKNDYAEISCEFLLFSCIALVSVTLFQLLNIINLLV